MADITGQVTGGTQITSQRKKYLPIGYTTVNYVHILIMAVGVEASLKSMSTRHNATMSVAPVGRAVAAGGG
jgi:hypothetical protein